MTSTGEHTLFRRPLDRCVACGSEHLDAVVENDTDDVHFLCRDCRRCWHVELGYVHRMAPHACHGCRYRDVCEPVYFADQVSV